MKHLEPWQLEAFAEVHKLTFPPPEWSGGVVERAARPALWVDLSPLDSVVEDRPSVCPMPLSWAHHWCVKKGIEVMHLPQFEDAFVGVGIFPKSQPCLVYDTSMLIDDMLEDCEHNSLAVSLFESRLSKAYYGNGSPGFITVFKF